MNLAEMPEIKAYLPSHPGNYRPTRRPSGDIRYIVIHYTGNTNDTAMNNLRYYAEANRGASAHYYCDESGVFRSVADEYAAYAVGLGSMSKPYTKNPSHYRICNNSNSLSIEICGSKTSGEGTEKTKWNAAQLCAYLMKKYNVPLKNVIRHYDVTGKSCPHWGVADPSKWDMFKAYVVTCMEGNMTYEKFCEFMDRWQKERAAEEAREQWEIDAMEEAANNGYITGGRPHSHVTRGELAVVLQRLKKKRRVY